LSAGDPKGREEEKRREVGSLKSRSPAFLCP